MTLLRRIAVPVLVPLMVLLSLTVLFRWTNADLAICRVFYGRDNAAWPLADAELWKFAYSYGTLPGLVLGIGGFTVAVASLAWRRLRAYRESGFFLAAMLALGPGLLVNGLFKPYWCRPRPKQVVEFGGNQQFVHVWGWTSARPSKSFPSGHASMGFYLMAPAFLLYRRRRRLASAFVVLGLSCGSLVGLARIVQGSHFPSDVVWSAGMVYLSGLVLSFLFKRHRTLRVPQDTGRATEFAPTAVAGKMDQEAWFPADEALAPQLESDRRKAA